MDHFKGLIQCRRFILFFFFPCFGLLHFVAEFWLELGSCFHLIYTVADLFKFILLTLASILHSEAEWFEQF